MQIEETHGSRKKHIIDAVLQKEKIHTASRIY